MHVLGKTFVRIEGVNRACQQQDAGETGAQRGRNRAADQVETKQKRPARSYLSHVRRRTASDSMVPFSSYAGYLPANVSLSLALVSESSLSRSALEQVVPPLFRRSATVLLKE